MTRFFPCILLAAVFGVGCAPRPPSDARLATPSELAAEVAGRGLGNVYVNPSARTVFAGFDVKMADVPPDSAVAGDPRAWRRLDRAHRFDGVLLAGPLAEYQALVEHLVESPDFRLVDVDGWGLLFTRQRAEAYVPPAPESVEGPPQVRAAILSQTALFLNAARLSKAATRYMDAALEADKEDPAVLARAGALALSRDRPREAHDQAAAALAIDSRHAAALEVQARALLAMGARDAAWETAERLRAVTADDDISVLYFHARLANAAGAYSREQDSLERLVAAAEKQGLPTADYRVYLGQCYARQGLARPALEQLERAAQAPNLSEEQKADLRIAIDTVRKHAGDLAR